MVTQVQRFMVQSLVKSQIHHRGHGDRRDKYLIKLDILCVLWELSSEKMAFYNGTRMNTDYTDIKFLLL